MNGQKLIRELTGLFFVFCGLLILLSLWSYDVKDPTLNQTVSGGAAVKNSAGLFGACLAGLLTDIFGFASYLWALFFLGMGAGLMTRFFILPWYRWFGYLLLYNLMFILPLLLLFLAAWRGTSMPVFLNWSRKNVVAGKTALGCLFLLLAALMLL